MNYPSNQCIDVLLVDDDEVDTMCVQREFKKRHYPISLQIVSNGLEALNKLYGINTLLPATPQLIILDIMMPKMNGIEFLQQLRTNPLFNEIHVIILTTSNNDKDKLALRDLNIAGYFIKQTQFNEFLCQMDQFINQPFPMQPAK